MIYAIIYCGGALLLLWQALLVTKNNLCRWERIHFSILAIIIMLHGILNICRGAQTPWKYDWINSITMFMALGMFLTWFIFHLFGRSKNKTP